MKPKTTAALSAIGTFLGGAAAILALVLAYFVHQQSGRIVELQNQVSTTLKLLVQTQFGGQGGGGGTRGGAGGGGGGGFGQAGGNGGSITYQLPKPAPDAKQR